MSCYSNQIKCAVAFGCGLLIASVFPDTFVVVVASITIIITARAFVRR